ncbi:MAG: hypothetical protein V7607_322 [Solirubrobacteraceae bacterium]
MDFTGDIAAAVDGAAARGHALVLGYIDDDGYPAVSFRGTTQVRGPQQLALWARKPDDGLARAIADRPQVSLLFYEPESAGLRYLTFRGRARVEPSANDEVYDNSIDGEKAHDPDRKGVAVVIDVDSVFGFGPDGPFQLER